jgi:5-(carboxyamino)imidazole ribonucleotide mutase
LRIIPVSAKPVAVIMGSQSDWATMKHAADTLDALGIAYEARIVSAHRTPDRLYAFAKGAKAAGVRVIIAGAGGAAHLPGMTASMTVLPVVGTLAIGRAGAINAALLAASVLALHDDALAGRLEAWRKCQTDAVAEAPSGEGGA